MGTDGSAGDGFVSSGGFGNRTRLTVLGKEGADKVKISLSLTTRGNSTPSRHGKKQIGGHFDPEVSVQLKILAAREDKSLEQVLADAFNEYFERRGIPPIA